MSGHDPVPSPAPASLPDSGSSTSATEVELSERPLWQLVVAALPPRDVETEWFSLHEIAPLLNLTPHALTHHCRDLWPTHEGHWRLSYSQAVNLIRRVCYAGRKLPSKAQVLALQAEPEAPRSGGEAKC